MERFIKATLGHSVSYEQPRLWNTKGETVAAYRRCTNNALDELFETRSGWQQRWNAKMGGKLRQCGLCAASLWTDACHETLAATPRFSGSEPAWQRAGGVDRSRPRL